MNLIKFLELYNKIRIDSSILEINLVPFFFLIQKLKEIESDPKIMFWEKNVAALINLVT